MLSRDYKHRWKTHKKDLRDKSLLKKKTRKKGLQVRVFSLIDIELDSSLNHLSMKDQMKVFITRIEFFAVEWKPKECDIIAVYVHGPKIFKVTRKGGAKVSVYIVIP